MILCKNCDPDFLICGDCAGYNAMKEYCVMHDVSRDPLDICDSFYCIIVMNEKLKELGIDNVRENS